MKITSIRKTYSLNNSEGKGFARWFVAIFLFQIVFMNFSMDTSLMSPSMVAVAILSFYFYDMNVNKSGVACILPVNHKKKVIGQLVSLLLTLIYMYITFAIIAVICSAIVIVFSDETYSSMVNRLKDTINSINYKAIYYVCVVVIVTSLLFVLASIKGKLKWYLTFAAGFITILFISNLIIYFGTDKDSVRESIISDFGFHSMTYVDTARPVIFIGIFAALAVIASVLTTIKLNEPRKQK